MNPRNNILTGAGNGETSKEVTIQSVDVLVSYGGTFDGGTITLEMLEQGNWEAVTEGTFTTPGQKLLQLAQGVELRATTSGGGGSMAVNLSTLPRY